MKRSNWHILYVCCIATSITYTMNDIVVGDPKTCSQQVIEYEGHTYHLTEHIRRSKIDSTYPFSANSVFRINEENQFIDLDNVRTHNFNEEEFNDINNGNWVFTQFYTNAKTHLIDKGSAAIGALILGTRNPEIAEALFDTALEEQIQKINKLTLERKTAKTSARLESMNN